MTPSETVKKVIQDWYDSLSDEEKVKPLAASSVSVITPTSVLNDVMNETEEGKKLIDRMSAFYKRA